MDNSNSGNQAQNQAQSQLTAQWVQSSMRCPNCGYCPHCGRSGGYYGLNGFYQQYPNYPYIDWNNIYWSNQVMGVNAHPNMSESGNQNG